MDRSENRIAATARGRALSELKVNHKEEFDRLFAKHVADIMTGVAYVGRSKPMGTATHLKAEDGDYCVKCGKAYPCHPARRRQRRGYN